MSGDVITFPGARRRDDGKHPATALTERLTANLANEDAVNCADALLRILASICCVNAINATEAIETAQLMAQDIEALVRDMMAPESAVAPASAADIADAAGTIAGTLAAAGVVIAPAEDAP